MSEKMDGVRAYWNGNKSISRQGKDISCPSWFTAGFPKVSLDGELWIGEGTSFRDVSTIIKSKQGNWGQIGYYVFDIPTSLATYEDRMKEMEDLKPVLPPHVHIIGNTICNSTSHLNEYLKSVLERNGEGVIVRRPNSFYQRGITASLLKVKVLT